VKKKTLIVTSVFTLALGLLLGGGSLCLGAQPGTTGADFLNIDVGGQGTAMGGAFTALANDGTGLYWNPAGFGDLDQTQVFAAYNLWFQSITHGYASFGMPLYGGGFAAALNYVSVGSIEGRDESGNPTASFNPTDLHVSLGYARRISPQACVGVSAGMVQETLVGEQERAFLGGAGLIWSSEMLRVGVSAQNIGSSLGGDPLPMVYRGGMAMETQSVTVAVDATKRLNQDIHYAAGLEFRMGEAAALRTGYNTGNDAGSGISYGAGFKLATVTVDYAYTPFGELGDAHRMSLGVGW